MPQLPPRKVTIFVSSPTDVMAERDRTALVIDRLQSRFREHLTITPIFFEDQYFTADKSFQAQIPDPGEADLVISIFWSKLGSELPSDLFGTMPDGQPYPGGAVYELVRALAAKERKNVPDILVYRKVADAGISVRDPEQRRLMNTQLDSFEAFWRQWFVSREGHFRAGFQTFTRPDEYERLVEGHLRGWLTERGLLGKEIIWRIAERGSPFRGLEPYEPEHGDVFFGRERETDRGRERLLQAGAGGCAFLLVLGPSGTGKSSLARAGVARRLTQPGDIDGVDVVRLALLRPGSAATPQRAFADALFRAPALPELADGDFPDPERLSAALTGEPATAAAPVLRALDRIAARLAADRSLDRPAAAQLVVVIDQLEELFAPTIADSVRTSFARLLDALARSGRALIIATLRTSDYATLAQEPVLLGLKDAGATLDVAVPGPEVLADVVRLPAGAAGLAFERRGEKGLDEVLLEAAGGNADALPLLGFTMQWLFEHRDGERLTFAAYDQLGGLEGAIGRAAEQAFGPLDQAAQDALPQLLRGLAAPSQGSGGLSLRDMRLTDVPEGSPLRRLADALVDARVLLVRGKSDTAVLRLAHEAVLRGWPRAREIATREQDFFRIRADVEEQFRRWEASGRSRELLIPRGLPLAEAETIVRHFPEELPEGLRRFIGRSARRVRVRQALAAAFAILFAFVARDYVVTAETRAHYLQFLAEHGPRIPVPRYVTIVLIGDQEYWDQLGGRTPISRDYLASLVDAAVAQGASAIALDFDMRLPNPLAQDIPAAFRDETRRLISSIEEAARHGTKMILGTSLAFDTSGRYSRDSDIYQASGLCVRSGAAPSAVNVNITCGYLALPTNGLVIPAAVPLNDGTLMESFAGAIATALRPDALDHASADGLYTTSLISSRNLAASGALVSADMFLHQGHSDAVRGRAVIIGGAWSSAGHGRGPRVDLHGTPLGTALGAVLQANYAEAILDGRTFRQLPNWIARVVEVLFALIGAFALSRLRGLWLVMAGVIATFALFLVAQWFALNAYGMFLDPSLTVLALISFYFLRRAVVS